MPGFDTLGSEPLGALGEEGGGSSTPDAVIQFTLAYAKSDIRHNLFFNPTYRVEYTAAAEFLLALSSEVGRQWRVPVDMAGDYVRRQFTLYVGMQDPAKQEFLIPLAFNVVSAQHVVALPMNPQVARQIDVPIGADLPVALQQALVWSMLGAVAQEHTLVFPLEETVEIARGFLLNWTMPSETLVADPFDPPHITVNGQQIDVLSAQVSFDEGNYFWVGDFELVDYRHALQFAVDIPFTFEIGGVTYHFVVDTKTIDRSDPASIRVVLSCLSPAVQLIAPRANPITRTWTATTTARAVAEEVLAGYPMTWGILDWPLPANLFAVSSRAPLDIVRELVAAVGAVVESLPNGELNVRYLFPDSVPSYGPDVATALLSDTDDLSKSEEGFRASRIYNRFRIMSSQDSTAADRLEFQEETSGVGELRAYPNPWRTTFTIESTRSNVTIGVQQYEEREEEEVVEVVAGQSTVRYPVLSITAIEFLDRDLTGVSFTPGSTTIRTTSETELYGLLRITYRVRALVYSVQGVAGQQAQFLMKDD